MSKKFCLLPRQVLRVTGVDRISFLQGLVTQDMTKLSPSQSLYSLLLTPQGRFLHDFFVVPSSPDAHGFFIEIDPKFGNALLKRLTLYKLRSQVTIEDVSSSISVLAIWNDENLPQNPTGSTIFEGAEISYQDPRLSELGQRRLTQNLQETESHLQSSGYERAPEQTYHTHRLKTGCSRRGPRSCF
jgi:folate-binding Fe-S cluster repair protein YgfZ